jgi:hypothetical protein
LFVCLFVLFVCLFVRFVCLFCLFVLQFPLRHDSCRQPQTYVKPEAAITVFELLMTSGVSLETS